MTPLTAYTKVNVATANASQIMISLFQAALRNIRASATAFESGDYRTGSLMAEKATNIVLGLQGTLKEDVAPELCANLKELYTFVACRLGMAGVKFSAAHAVEAERVFAPVAEAFIQVGSNPNNQPGAGSGR